MRDGVFDPPLGGGAIDLKTLREQRTSKVFAIICHDNSKTRMPSHKVCCESSRTASDNKQVTVHIPLLILLTIRKFRRLPETRNGSNEAFVKMPVRPHHRLVVEGCREQPLKGIKNAEHVMFSIGPSILTCCAQAGIERHQRCPDFRLIEFA